MMEGMVWASRLVRLPIRKEQHFHDYTLVSLPNATSIYPVLWSPVFLKVSANCKTRPSDFVLRLLLSGKSLQSYNREKSNVGSLGSGTQWCCLVALSIAFQGGKPMFVSWDVTFVKPTPGHWRVHYVLHLRIWIYIYIHIYFTVFSCIRIMYHVPSTVNKTSPFLTKSKHDKQLSQLRTTRRKFKQSKWRAFVTWLAFQSNGARCICASISPYPPRFHGQPSSELDRIFGRCGCCQSAEGPVELIPWGELAGSTKSHKSRPWPYKNHEKSSKIEDSLFEIKH